MLANVMIPGSRYYINHFQHFMFLTHNSYVPLLDIILYKLQTLGVRVGV